MNNLPSYELHSAIASLFCAWDHFARKLGMGQAGIRIEGDATDGAVRPWVVFSATMRLQDGTYSSEYRVTPEEARRLGNQWPLVVERIASQMRDGMVRSVTPKSEAAPGLTVTGPRKLPPETT